MKRDLYLLILFTSFFKQGFEITNHEWHYQVFLQLFLRSIINYLKFLDVVVLDGVIMDRIK